MTLDRECAVFCRYLIGQEPNEYVKKKYRAAHQSLFSAERRRVPRRRFSSQSCQHQSREHKNHRCLYADFPSIFDGTEKARLVAGYFRKLRAHACVLGFGGRGSDSTVVPSICQSMLNFCLVVMVGVLIILPAELMLRANVKRLVFVAAAKWITW